MRLIRVAILTNVATNAPRPRLRETFGGAASMPGVHFQAGVRERADCLPFMASVQVDRDSAVRMSALFARLSLLRESFIGAAPRQRKEPIVIQSGSRAMLLLDSERVHIRIPVICLQSGSAGETIRVSTPEAWAELPGRRWLRMACCKGGWGAMTRLHRVYMFDRACGPAWGMGPRRKSAHEQEIESRPTAV